MKNETKNKKVSVKFLAYKESLERMPELKYQARIKNLYRIACIIISISIILMFYGQIIVYFKNKGVEPQLIRVDGRVVQERMDRKREHTINQIKGISTLKSKKEQTDE
jgi:hypothetical protein